MLVDIAAELVKANSILGHIKNGAPRAINGALNRTIDGVKTDIVAHVRNTYDIKPGEVRKLLKATHSKPTTLQASIRAKGSRIPLIQFHVTPNKPGQQSSGTVLRASVKQSGGKPIPGAFVMKMSDGKLGVAMRVGKQRLPVKELYGPAIPQMIGEENIQKYVMNGADERFKKRIDHEIDRLLSGFDAPGKWER